MIEREFIKDRAKQLKIKEYISEKLSNAAGIGSIVIEKTPLGEKIVISAVKPGLVIGRAGKTISELTYTLRSKFGLENPQIEVREVINPNVNAQIVSQRIVNALERFGAARFKAIGYRELQGILAAGSIGAEIRIGGRGVPSQRAKSWLFYAGHMKKCGDVAMSEVDIAKNKANLNSGTVGVQVKIMPLGIKLPDIVIFKEAPKIIVKEVEPTKAEKEIDKEEPKTEPVKEEIKTDEKEAKKKAPRKRKAKEEKSADAPKEEVKTEGNKE